MKLATLFVFAALSALAQTNAITFTNRLGETAQAPPETFQAQTNQSLSIPQQAEVIRAACIENRRSICGKILKMLPAGFVVDSGYTNLLRAPINHYWLVPGTASANRASNIIESNEPNSVCIGLVFLTDIPKSRRLKPKIYDYVIIEAYPTGQYTYTSVGSVQRTVRKFSANLEAAVRVNLENSEK
jgi:hypothetical protein